MIDINAIINNAITNAVINTVNAAIAQATQPLVERIAELEQKLKTITEQPKQEITGNISRDSLHALVAPMVESMVDAKIDEAISAHCEEYDHDEYDRMLRTMEDHDLDDFVKQHELEDAVKEAVQDLNFDIRVSVS